MSPEVRLIQTTLYFSVSRGLAYPDYTVFQCPQRSDLSRLHCISVSPEVRLIQTTLYFSVPRGLTYPDYTVFQCLQRSDLSRLHCISVSPEVRLIQATLYSNTKTECGLSVAHTNTNVHGVQYIGYISAILYTAEKDLCIETSCVFTELLAVITLNNSCYSPKISFSQSQFTC